MNIPQEAKRLASLMHADIDRVLSPEEDLFDYLLGGVTMQERPIAAEFIDALLALDLKNEELVAKWIEAGADASVHPEDIVPFLSELRDRLRTR